VLCIIFLGEKKKSGVPDAVFMISTPPLHAEMEIKTKL